MFGINSSARQLFTHTRHINYSGVAHSALSPSSKKLSTLASNINRQGASNVNLSRHAINQVSSLSVYGNHAFFHSIEQSQKISYRHFHSLSDMGNTMLGQVNFFHDGEYQENFWSDEEDAYIAGIIDRIKEHGPSIEDNNRYAESMNKILIAECSHLKNEGLNHKELMLWIASENLNSLESANNFFQTTILGPPLAQSSSLPLFEIKEIDIEKEYKKNLDFQKRRNNFHEKLERITDDNHMSRDEKVKAIKEIVYEEEKGGDKLNCLELKKIHSTLWDLDAYDEMVEMRYLSDNVEFKHDIGILPLHARATLKSHYNNHYILHSIADHLMQDPAMYEEGIVIKGLIATSERKNSKELLKAMREDPENVPEGLLKEYMRYFPNDGSRSENSIHENYKNSLRSAYSEFKEAFSKNYDCRYGSRMIHLLLELENAEQTNRREELENIARLTLKAAEKDGGVFSNNPAVLRAYLTALYLLPDSKIEEIKLAEDALVVLFKGRKSIEYAIQDFSELNLSLHRQGQDLQRYSVHFLVQAHHIYVEGSEGEYQAFINEAKARFRQAVGNNEWHDRSYNIKGFTSNSIDGNFQFGAQLPDHALNLRDRAYIEEMIETHFSGIETIEEFNFQANQLIRNIFQTDARELETLTSDGHKLYDKAVHAIIEFAGVPTIEARKDLCNSWTNISTVVSLGLGDCRHHAQLKQILFDVWHGQKLNQVLSEMQQAEEENHEENIQAFNEKFNRINQIEFRTADCEVYLPIKIENGAPVVNDEGHFIKNDTGKLMKVEEHTFNMSFNKNDVTIVDAFYQNRYDWENCKILQTDSGQFTGAGAVKIYDESSGTYEKVAVLIKPTSYAGKRDDFNRAETTSSLIGIPVELPSYKKLINEENVGQVAQNLVDWFVQRS